MGNSAVSGLKQWSPLLGLIVFALAMAALNHLSAEISLSALQAELAKVSMIDLALSALAALASYAVLTIFDWRGLVLVGHRVPWAEVFRVSFVANALGHNLGMAALTGGTVRLRGYARHGLDAPAIAQVIGMASLGFALGALTWLGGALLFETKVAANALHLPTVFLQTLGGLLWLGLGVFISWLGPAPRQWVVRGHVLRLPDRSSALLMWVVSVFELAFAAAALYVFLPDNLPVSFLGFVGLYVLAIFVGLASTVPAGLGVFEASLLLLLPGEPSVALLAAVLLYRAVYYLLPLLLALFAVGVELINGSTLRSRWRWWGPVQKVAHAGTALWPPLLATTSFAAGALLLLSGSLPLHQAQVPDVPLWLLEGSHLLGSVVGVLLLLLARGLAARVRLAWTLSIWALSLGLVAALIVGAQWPFLLVLIGSLFGLWLGRRRFLRSVATLSGEGALHAWVGAALVVVAAIWIGLFAYRHVGYSHELWWQFALDANAPRMLRASVVAVLMMVAGGGMLLFLPGGITREVADPEQRRRARALFHLADASNAWLAMVPDKQILFDPQGDGFLMYQRSGPCLIAMGDPVGTPSARANLCWRFREIADKAGLWPVFYQVGVADLPLYLDLGLQLAKLGEEAVVLLGSFSLEGSERAALRQEHRRAQRSGCQFQIVEGSALDEVLPTLRAVSDEWLSKKAGQEKGFSLGWFDAETLRQGPVALVKVNDTIVAFANLWLLPNRRECSIDLMRHTDSAPKSSMDFLFVELMLWSKAQGFATFNLGMAPLAGFSGHELAPLWHKLGGFAWRHGERFYGFEGLRRYKAKFRPEWTPRYLASPGGWRQTLALFHVARLISGATRIPLS